MPKINDYLGYKIIKTQYGWSCPGLALDRLASLRLLHVAMNKEVVKLVVPRATDAENEIRRALQEQVVNDVADMVELFREPGSSDESALISKITRSLLKLRLAAIKNAARKWAEQKEL